MPKAFKLVVFVRRGLKNFKIVDEHLALNFSVCDAFNTLEDFYFGAKDVGRKKKLKRESFWGIFGDSSSKLRFGKDFMDFGKYF